MIRGRFTGAIAERVAVVREKEGQPAKPAILIICANCKQSLEHCAFGLCNTCYSYQKRHDGTPRPRRFIQHQLKKKSSPKWCMTCGSPRLDTMYRCIACYDYWIRYRKPRPKWMWDEDICCENCDFPKKAALSARNGSVAFHKTRCRPCYYYLRRTGRERPEHLLGKGKYGFCDCGYPAEHQIDKINMCNRCVRDYK